MVLRTRFGIGRQERGGWPLLLLLLLGVLGPTGAVFWFMNEAVRSQAEAARQSVADAYRGQLRLLRNRVEEGWRARVEALERAPDFPGALRASGADSVILLDSKGSARYPAPPAVPQPDPTFDRAEWTAARELEGRGDRLVAAARWARLAASEKNPTMAALAAQGQIRSLVRGGQRVEAIRAIDGQFGGGRLARAVDFSGRMIAADEQLLALQIMKPGEAHVPAVARKLAALVNDYRSPMPSAQRLYLMSELRTLAPAAAFPTERAERLAAQFLESERVRPGEAMLEASGVRGLYKLTAAGGGAIALYRSETVIAAMDRMMAEQGNGSAVKFQVTPPGVAATDDAIAAGVMLPGWQIGFSLLDQGAFEDAARRRMAAYLWVGYLVIAAIAITGVLIGQSVRREFRLARLKTDLVAAVSHELKTPLASMRLLVETLLDEPGASPRKTREYLELISGENHRLGRLIDNFLTFSRIDRNRQHFEFAPTRPEDVVRHALATMRERMRGPECHVEVDVPADLPPLRADEDALVTVLLNLLDNAYKYTPGEKRISLSARRENGNVVFLVADNGIGIAAREQKRIFRRFYQVDQRLARETGGCGLGLNIVDFIVHAHGGTVTVESTPGAGSRFRVVLPVVLPCAAREKEAVV